jgi:cellulose synthase/poly-beta-1,6-N-acetylglucosamine synthase-like glycosyltransferase
LAQRMDDMDLVMLVLALARWALRGLLLVLAAPTIYLCLIAAIALVADRARRRARTAPSAAPCESATRFVVLVPAHDEEALLGVTLGSLQQQTYPRERYRVVVIADNCGDRTSEIARSFEDIWVYERRDPSNRGKGQALRWVFERLKAEGHAFDAYVVVDADSLAEPALLAELAEGIAGGARALQVHYTVRNSEEAPSAALRWLALALRNHVLPYGRSTLGGSAQLLGNGMCFTRALLERHPWQVTALAEDLQYYLALVQAGERVAYVPGVAVRGHMPTSFAQMRTQDIRWESPLPQGQGRGATLRLLRDGIHARDIVRLDAFAARLVPPLSMLVGAWLLTMLTSLVLRAPIELLVSIALGCGLLFYISSALLF